MTDDLEVLIRETLDDRLAAVASEPGDPAAVRRRSTRLRSRRRATAGILAAGVACGVLTVVVAARHDSGAVQPAQDPTVTAARCPADANPAKLPLPHDGVLRSGAVMASLCPMNGADWQPPADALTTRLDQLVALINGTPEPGKGENGGCLGMPQINDYSITFVYPDGSRSAVWTSTCSETLFTGGDDRRVSSGVLQSYLADLAAQRADGQPLAPAKRPACPAQDGGGPQPILPTGPDLGMTSASLCSYTWTKVGKGEFTFALASGSPLSQQAVRLINMGFERQATPIDPNYDTGNHLVVVVGVTTWGEPVYLDLLHGQLVRGRSPSDVSNQSLGWRLSTADRSALGLR